MRIKLLDRILLAAIRWRLKRAGDEFADELAALLVAEIDALKGPLQKHLDGWDRENRQAQQAAMERMRLAAAIDKFKSFEPGERARLQ